MLASGELDDGRLHERIGLILGPADHVPSLRKLAAHRAHAGTDFVAHAHFTMEEGQAAVSLLMSQLDAEPVRDDELLFEPELVVRASTAPNPRMRLSRGASAAGQGG